jgi:hypothetical protein
MLSWVESVRCHCYLGLSTGDSSTAAVHRMHAALKRFVSIRVGNLKISTFLLLMQMLTHVARQQLIPEQVAQTLGFCCLSTSSTLVA